MIQDDREALIEEEEIILRNSGEIPEIALHSSIYYLEEDEEGPEITLQEDELHRLYDAALSRAREIVLRDLNPDNRDLSIYRGPARSIVNWYRLQSFCQRIGRDCRQEFRERVAQSLLLFMEREFEDSQQSVRSSSVNCSAEDIHSFCRELCLKPDLLPQGWKCLCDE